MPLGRTQAFALDFLLKGSGETTPAWDVLLRGERRVLESSHPPLSYADRRNDARSMIHPLRVAKAEPPFGFALRLIGCGCLHNALA